MSVSDVARRLDDLARDAVADGLLEDDANHIIRMRRAGLDPGVGLTRSTIPHGPQAEPPRPLIREMPPAEPFPVDALGDILGSASKAINDRVQAPMAICGQSVLAAATLAVQGHADIQLPTGHTKPISSYFVTVGESGERKTACDTEALWPFRTREQALRESYDKALPRYENAFLAWEEARKHAVKAAKGDRAALMLALDKIGPGPKAPLAPMLTCSEPTLEGLTKYLASGQPSVGIFSGEGGQFIGGHGMTQEAILRTAAGLSALWDGGTIKRVRASDGVLMLPGRRVAMHLMAQPAVAARMLSDALLLDQGLLSRCLVTAPESSTGSRIWHDPAMNTDAAIKRYGASMLAILERQLPLVGGAVNELVPRPLPLSQEARAIWIEFADSIEAQLKPDGALAPIKGLANKLPEHAARLAAVLTLVADIGATVVEVKHLTDGIALAQHYATEALRVFDSGLIGDDLALARRLHDWIQRQWPGPNISLPDIYQNGPNAIREKATAARLVKLLEDHGWLARIEGGAEVAGHHRRAAWKVIRG